MEQTIAGFVLSDEAIAALERQQYRVVGSHSAVKNCYWTKQSLIAERVCFKELWYKGARSHRCMQMTAFIGCNYRCSFCWRVHSRERPGLVRDESAPSAEEAYYPEFILDGAIQARKKLLQRVQREPSRRQVKAARGL